MHFDVPDPLLMQMTGIPESRPEPLEGGRALASNVLSGSLPLADTVPHQPGSGGDCRENTLSVQCATMMVHGTPSMTRSPATGFERQLPPPSTVQPSSVPNPPASDQRPTASSAVPQQGIDTQQIVTTLLILQQLAPHLFPQPPTTTPAPTVPIPMPADTSQARTGDNIFFHVLSINSSDGKPSHLSLPQHQAINR